MVSNNADEADIEESWRSVMLPIPQEIDTEPHSPKTTNLITLIVLMGSGLSILLAHP